VSDVVRYEVRNRKAYLTLNRPDRLNAITAGMARRLTELIEELTTMGALTGAAYWPADTSEPVLELTTGDLLRKAAGDAGTQVQCRRVLGRLAEAVARAH
jgi:hypothetical protein